MDLLNILKPRKIKVGRLSRNIGLSKSVLINVLESASEGAPRYHADYYLNFKEVELLGFEYFKAIEHYQKTLSSVVDQQEGSLAKIVSFIKFFAQFIYLDESLKYEVESSVGYGLPKAKILLNELLTHEIQEDLVLDLYFKRIFNDVAASYSVIELHHGLKFSFKLTFNSKPIRGYSSLFKIGFYIYPKEDEERREEFDLLQIGLSKFIYSGALNNFSFNLKHYKWNKKMTFL